ncbi:flavin reductase family protein [Desulforamulus ferrireducens]|uniref:Flavin reductase n=1 Tax=Desulforamulus ferrireducens TaxID=1833852 RepID=A0A1S6IYL3_9FIRM|nr:flavin reductase [Desulforamulus ferrireducens]AQS59869.1 flavin reductase [Desulforamulus ferrireducens]
MSKWRCTVCGYIYEGVEPPETCPLCGVDKTHFEKVVEEKTGNCEDAIKKALRHISYGLYIVSSRQGEKINGQCANTVFQITSDPVRLAIGINKNNLTHEYIQASQVFSVSILDTNGLDLVKKFGFRSGREVDKFTDVNYELGTTATPLLQDCLAALECKVVGSMDLGTHTLFIGEVVCALTKGAGEPMTYALYHQIKNKPAATPPQEASQWRCKVCGYIHTGQQPPEVCPVCNVGPEEFEKI